MYINNNGNVGIGTTSPGYLLDVNGTAQFRGAMYFGTTGQYGLISYTSNYLSVRGRIGQMLYLGSNDTDGQMVINNGNVGIGTTAPTRRLWVNGDAGGTSSWYNDSDERLKKNITQIDNGLDKVMRLRGVYFEWKDTTNHPEGRQVGLIAQEVEKVVPEVVDKKGEYYSIATANLVPVLIEAIKEQQKEIEKLRLEIEELRKQR